MKKIIITFFIISLFLMLNITKNVDAEYTIYSEGFEGGVATMQLSYGQSNSGLMNTEVVSGTGSYITTSYKRSGTYSYRVYGNADVITFNYNIGGGITSFYWYLYTPEWGCNPIYFYFRNATTDHDLIVMYVSYSNSYYLNEVGDSITLVGGDYASFIQFGMNITNVSGTVRYNRGGVYVDGIARNPSYIYNGETIDYIYITFSGGTASGHYIDDISFNVSDEYSGGGGGVPCEPTTYQIYDEGIYTNLPIGEGFGRYVEDKFETLAGGSISGDLTDVRLSISNDQKNYVGTFSSYRCVVNGEELGEADGMYGVGSDWWVYWLCDIPLIDDKPIISFGCLEYIPVGGSGCYWFGIGITETIPYFFDFKYHNDTVKHNNSIYDGTITSMELVYILTVDCVEESEPPIDTNETNATSKDIYIKFYDKSNGDLLRFKGLDIAESLMLSYDFIDALLYSTYTTNGLRSSYQTNDYLTVNINFTEGTFITFKVMDTGFTNFRGREDGSYKMFKAMEYTIQAYEGLTYTFYLEPVGFIDGVIYNNSGNDKTSGYVECAINKRYYDFGETIRLRYKLPSEQWLVENGYVRSSYYRLKIYNKDDYLFGYVRRNVFFEASRVYEYSGLIFDNNYHTLDIPIISYNDYGFDEYYNDYEIVIENWDRDFLKKDTLLDSLYFWVTGDEYVPNGTIYDIEPNPSYFGQSVTISWFSNGQGRIEINYPSGDTYFSVPYLYSDGLHTIEKTMTGIGTFSVELYTYSVLENTSYPVDTDTLVVNPLGGNGTYGSYGFGLPYLYIPNYRVIAGYDTVQIYYRTYKNDSILKILSPRGETTYFSTTVSNQSDNVLNIPIPNYMQIGEWNVTFLCGDINGTSTTLYSSFNVVNEENNWVEFTKHVYNTDEVFEVFIKHSYRVALTLYKDDVAQGETIIFNLGEYANAKYLIPLSIITPSIGNWRVEMWRINDRNIVYELAEDECIVKQGTNKNKIDIGFGIVIPPLIKIILGILIVVVMTILPMLISFALSRGGTNINIPALVYVAFFFFGLVISVILDFISIIVPFIILFGLVIAFAVMWLRGQSTGE